ncbi:hypothetical protein M2284_002878 [Rhodococcus sp. LBL1]|nr:hypothetical protein [Rhodococcus sp. LBL1]MDH6684457.1 hypothetical protein [Rhodococcus sp. LBL2]
MGKVLMGAVAAGAIAIGGVVVVSVATGAAEPAGGDRSTSAPGASVIPEDHDWEMDPIVEGPEPTTDEEFARDAHDPSEDGRPPVVSDRPAFTLPGP